MNAIDLFCGCGGLTEGLKQAGFTVKLAVDIASIPLKTYSLNHPEVKIINEDIRQLTGAALLKEIKQNISELDLLAGCPPCQGFSSMRTKNGKYSAKDPRNGLIGDFFRIALELKPKMIMLENVPGLKNYPLFIELINSMRCAGYTGEYLILNAQNYQVPQRRRRLIYIASRDRKFVFDKTPYSDITVRDAIGNLPVAGKSGDSLHDKPRKHTPRIKKMISLIPKDGGSRSDLPEEFILPCHRRNPDGFKDVYGRMQWDAPSPTITGGCASPSKGRFLHPEKNRGITLREAAILQGFPPKYRFSEDASQGELALMIGNALPPPFIRIHAEQIKKHLTRGTDE